MNNITKVDSLKCYGCGACYASCPKKAIEMKMDSHGFYKPFLIKEKCINCGICLNKCIIEKSQSLKNTYIDLYGVKNRDTDIRNKSTSGGAFSLLFDYFKSLHGSIYACTLKNKEVMHIKSNVENVFLGSKYVQSNLNNIFLEILNDLSEDNYVLFVGTPCQCAGLKSFLLGNKIETNKLLIVDFICHGTPSPKIFSDYVNYVEKKFNKKIIDHRFRPKINGWKNHIELNVYSDGSSDSRTYESQLFKSIFYSHLGMKNACFACEFASRERVSDITMADFWGIEKKHADFYDDSGVSFLMINTKKGSSCFSQIQKNCDYIKVSIGDVNQPQLLHPISMPDKYEAFWNDYDKKGFVYVIKKYYRAGAFYRFLSNIKNRLIK